MVNIIKLVEYNGWANQKLLNQIKSFDQKLFEQEVGGSFPSIRHTVVHMLESDWIWMNRWKGIPLASIPSEWNTDTISSIAAIWSSLQLAMLEAVKTLSANQIEKIEFVTKRGVPYVMSLHDTVIHACNHGTYHRGQIANLIRMLGQKPESTDYFIFCTTNN